jgi:two-component system cell cycle response regulator CtrA
MRALVVEDDPVSAKLIETALKEEGIISEPADSGEDAIDLAKHYDFDIIVLDLGLPDMEGFDVVRRLRAAKVRTPVLILSAMLETDDKVRGLTTGADDYLTKPFHKTELIARIHAIVRRSKGHSESVIKTGKLLVNLDTRSVDVDGRRLHVTGKEYSILELLSLRKGTTLTKEMFLDHLYGGIDEPELKIIDVFICKLRKKIATATGGQHYIETVWGRGYVLKDPESVTDAEMVAEAGAALDRRPRAAVA